MKFICNVQNNCDIKIEIFPVIAGVYQIFSNNFAFNRFLLYLLVVNYLWLYGIFRCYFLLKLASNIRFFKELRSKICIFDFIFKGKPMIKQKILSKVAVILFLLAFLTASACRTCNCPAYSRHTGPDPINPSMNDGSGLAEAKPASPAYHTIIL